MTFDNFTVKAQEAIFEAQNLTSSLGQQTVDTPHLLGDILKAEESVAEFLLSKCGVNIPVFKNQLEQLIRTYPKVEGGSKEYLSNDANKALSKAKSLLTEMGDEYISVELLLLAIAAGNDKGSKLLKESGVSFDLLKKAISELRKGRKVTDQHSENTYNSLNKYAINLTDRAEEGKLDPIVGRDDEIRRVLHILSRRKKNNPFCGSIYERRRKIGWRPCKKTSWRWKFKPNIKSSCWPSRRKAPFRRATTTTSNCCSISRIRPS